MEFTPVEYSHRTQPATKEELKTKKKELSCLTKLQGILAKGKLSEAKLHDCQMAAGKTSDAFKEKFSKIITQVRIPQKVETVKSQIKLEINSIKRDIRAFEKAPAPIKSQGKKREREVEEEPPEPVQAGSMQRVMNELGGTVGVFAAYNITDLLAEPNLPNATGKLLKVVGEATLTYAVAKTAITAITALGSLWSSINKTTEETEAKKHRKETDDVANK